MTRCFKCGATLIEACPNSIRETKDKLKAIKHHFKTHECMYVFDFNILMDEVSSQFNKKGE